MTNSQIANRQFTATGTMDITSPHDMVNTFSHSVPCFTPYRLVLHFPLLPILSATPPCSYELFLSLFDESYVPYELLSSVSLSTTLYLSSY
jgi:hypothetical protein